MSYYRKLELKYLAAILLGGVFLILILGAVWTLKKYREGTI